MLLDLKILNGKMSLKFDKYNTKYTVILNNREDTKLEMEYKLADDVNISIAGNTLDKDYNEVVLNVYNDKESVNYYLYVYKEETTDVSNINIYNKDLDVSLKKEISPYAAPGIGVTCFLLILFLFVLLFRKKKKN